MEHKDAQALSYDPVHSEFTAPAEKPTHGANRGRTVTQAEAGKEAGDSGGSLEWGLRSSVP